MMLKLTHTTKNAALAAVLTAGLAGTAAVTFLPQTVRAQDYDDRWRDRDDAYWRAHYYDYYHRDWDDRGWVGIGVPGFGVGFYTGPTYYGYHRYCSDWDWDHGYCR